MINSYLCIMETNNKTEIYELKKQVIYLNQIINELQTELFKLKCGVGVTKNKRSSKKDELFLALSELKRKTNKTQRDKDNIYTIEMVLKNMK